ncbi:MAG TPA: acetylxylan esterase, partial [Candidatus Glassbacteria bacterium]|nr:acetylxylan esterase [Candidatus Glassbacteria bacterium]
MGGIFIPALISAVLLAAPNFPLPQADNGRGLRLAVSVERESHFYTLGDSAGFEIEIQGLKSAGELSYRFSLEKASTVAESTRQVNNGRLRLSGALGQPGFLRLDLTLAAGADTLRAAESAGFSPEAIRPTGVRPSDYRRFWQQGRAELLRIPADPQIISHPEADTAGTRRYLVSLANIEGSRIYGWLSVPAGEGPFPAVVHIPGAPGGINEFHTPAHRAYAEAGMIVLVINIHGVPLGREDSYYRQLQSLGFMGGFPELGIDDRYRYYYRRVVLGAVRAVDYLAGRSDVDTSRIGLGGESQGGGLSLLLASIDRRIKAVTLHVP